jgi:hypothetical protein
VWPNLAQKVSLASKDKWNLTELKIIMNTNITDIRAIKDITEITKPQSPRLSWSQRALQLSKKGDHIHTSTSPAIMENTDMSSRSLRTAQKGLFKKIC